MLLIRRRYVATLLLVASAACAGLSVFAIAEDSPTTAEWSPPTYFPNVAVAKIAADGDLQLLIPVLDCEVVTKTRVYTVSVPYSETVGGVEKQLTRQESRQQQYQVTICGTTFKMVRTSIPSQSIELTDTLGNSLPLDQVKHRLSQATYIVLGSSTPTPFVAKMLRKDALFLSMDKVDPNFRLLPPVQGLQAKWTRAEGLLTTAVAQLVAENDTLQVSVTVEKQRAEARTRTVGQADGSQVEQPYTVSIPYSETVQNSVNLSQCEIETVGGELVTLAQAKAKLAEPCRIFFDCKTNEYLSSILEADTLVIRTKKTD